MRRTEGPTMAVLTGAGISAESGLATFRGMGGLWENEPVEAVASPEGWARDPVKVWTFYQARRVQAAGVRPNGGHLGLARLGNALGDRFTLVTQNVDGLHQEAGSRGVLELHGSLWRVRCTRCGREDEDRTVPFAALPPPCPHCGSALRPAIVWFGEVLPQDVFAAAFAAAEACALFLVVGTSGAVQPAAGLAMVAASAGAEIWEVNPEPTPITALCSRSWRSGAGAVMDEVAAEALARLSPGL